ncbi:protein phosphatase 2C domain-containing protein [Actinosynnema sp. NPDC059335]|uniref:protein phosphatase 2C domain-containing protein n=1 Tax=Actinosynnema sp. NPDC059335 TaxID=3346804 RepID=UPI00366CF1B9
MLPGGSGPGQDRWRTVGRAAVVLDGASSFTPALVDAGEYVDHLMTRIVQRLPHDRVNLRQVVADSIRRTADELKLPARGGPSSTVLIASSESGRLKVLALGDSTALVRTTDGSLHRVTDDRLSAIASNHRKAYRARLSSGTGYDEMHKRILRALQEEELKWRNRPSGYWIAESDPEAANEAVERDLPADEVEWLILATDGAQRTIDHLGIPWNEVAQMSSSELEDLLRELHRWEEVEDRAATLLPRAKVHDDKTIVVWHPLVGHKV